MEISMSKYLGIFLFRGCFLFNCITLMTVHLAVPLMILGLCLKTLTKESLTSRKRLLQTLTRHCCKRPCFVSQATWRELFSSVFAFCLTSTQQHGLFLCLLCHNVFFSFASDNHELFIINYHSNHHKIIVIIINVIIIIIFFFMIFW